MFSVRALFVGMALVFLFSAVVFVPAASAADIRSGERVVVAADQVINDDLYVSAQDLVIDGTVNGDVYALAQTITINGTVAFDVNAAAQTLTINGTVGYDVNAAAQTLTINGKVGSTARLAGQTITFSENAEAARSLLAAAFSLETKPGARIGNDLLFGAYQGLLAGDVSKDVIAAANGIELRGTVGRNMRVTVGDPRDSNFSPRMFMSDLPVSVPTVPAGLTIAPSAVIGGELVYESQQTANVESGAQVTGPVVQQTPVPTARERTAPLTPEAQQALQTQALVNSLLNHARRFVILLLLGLLAMWLLPKFVGTLADALGKNPLGSFGRGLLMIVGFIAALFVIALGTLLLALFFGLLTLGDLAGLTISTGIVIFGVLTFAYSVFVSYAAPIVVSFLIGHAILVRMQTNAMPNRFIAFIIGLVLLSLVSLIPFLNVLIGIGVAVVALGALALWFGARRAGMQAAVMQAA